MDEIDAKLEAIDEAYKRVRPKAARKRDDLLEKVAEMLRGDYTLEVIRNTVPIYEFGRMDPVLYVDTPSYRITSYDRLRNQQEQVELGEEVNVIPEFQNAVRDYFQSG